MEAEFIAFSVEKQQKKELILACFRHKGLDQWCMVWSGDSWLASGQDSLLGNRGICVTVNFVLQAGKMRGSQRGAGGRPLQQVCFGAE